MHGAYDLYFNAQFFCWFSWQFDGSVDIESRYVVEPVIVEPADTDVTG